MFFKHQQNLRATKKVNWTLIIVKSFLHYLTKSCSLASLLRYNFYKPTAMKHQENQEYVKAENAISFVIPKIYFYSSAAPDHRYSRSRFKDKKYSFNSLSGGHSTANLHNLLRFKIRKFYAELPEIAEVSCSYRNSVFFNRSLEHLGYHTNGKSKKRDFFLILIRRLQLMTSKLHFYCFPRSEAVREKSWNKEEARGRFIYFRYK